MLNLVLLRRVEWSCCRCCWGYSLWENDCLWHDHSAVAWSPCSSCQSGSSHWLVRAWLWYECLKFYENSCARELWLKFFLQLLFIFIGLILPWINPRRAPACPGIQFWSSRWFSWLFLLLPGGFFMLLLVWYY